MRVRTSSESASTVPASNMRSAMYGRRSHLCRIGGPGGFPPAGASRGCLAPLCARELSIVSPLPGLPLDPPGLAV